MGDRSLRAIAAGMGITVTMPAGTETEQYLVSLLQAAHLPVAKAAEAEALLQQMEEQLKQEMLDPVQVLEESAIPVTVPVRVRFGDERIYNWTLVEENGTRHEGRFTRSELLIQAGMGPDSRSDLSLNLPLGLSLESGYHEVTIRQAEQAAEEARASQLLIVAPSEGYVPTGIADDHRVWGLSVLPQAIRSRDNWGMGDFSDIMKLLGSTAAAGAGTLHIGPLSSCIADCLDSGESGTVRNTPHPYCPSCRAQLNVLLIDVTAIADFSECEAVNSLVEQTEFQAQLNRLRERTQLDYAEVCRIKEEHLRKLWDCFYANHLYPETARGRAFRRFQERGGETLHLFAVFSALDKKFSTENQDNNGWAGWPVEYTDCSSQQVGQFAQDNTYEIEYYQYLQWQAEIQLAAIGRRSMELGLKVGLLGEFPFSVHVNGFESWRYKEALLTGATAAGYPLDSPGHDPAVGLPVFLPQSLRRIRYRPFIEGLRQSMRYAGALIIDSISNYFRTPFNFAGRDDKRDSFISWPFAEILGIIALESRRNRCLVIADNSHLLPGPQQRQLRQRKIFSCHDFLQARNDRQEWLSAAEYPTDSVVRSSPPFLTSVRGFWQSRDILLLAAERFFVDDGAKERAIIARAGDRVQLVITLHHEDLLPEEYTVELAAAMEMDRSLLVAVQIFLARSPAKILLLPIPDLLGLELQAEPPGLSSRQFWEAAYPADLPEILDNAETASLYKALCRERGRGNVRPSALISERKNKSGPPLPLAFYRLQLHKEFDFRQATAILPYLGKLGITHCYLSPFLAARPGSRHGYDIIDHSTINPEIGSRQDFENFLAVLEQQGMALVLDIVPNHMGIGSDNQWWMDVLENGAASKYARFFDINWHPQQADLSGRMLLPVLGDYYGKVLENGELTLCFDDGSGTFFIRYFDHRFPISPSTYPPLLSYDIDRLGKRLGEGHHSYQELQHLIQALGNLTGHGATSPAVMQVRHRNKEVSTRTLARLCRKHAEIKQFIDENVILLNGVPGRPESFDLLHLLLEEQPYRLAFWRVAADEINYRRFFDINDLAGLRMEEPEVFDQTHGLILDLVATGRLDGLRIDHPDGLYDPLAYFCRLQDFVAGQVHNESDPRRQHGVDQGGKPLYLVVEKILADFEDLPENWPISGTTGYDFSHYLNGLLVNSAAEKTMTSGYFRFIGSRVDYDQLMYTCKKLIIRFSMAGELNVLTSLLYRLAKTNRHTRDLTYNSLRDALIEVVCFFPVYRTYVSEIGIGGHDAQYIEWALAKAESRQHLDDSDVFRFIKSVLLLENAESEEEKKQYLDFVRKFQQYTGPIMAKGVEDTFFYRYNCLLSQNEVGGNPKCFGISVPAFHQANQRRLLHWPHAMLTTSTHDSKRSEDVRARINVLTEMADTWQRRVRLWSMQNRSHKTSIDGNPAPSKNDEYGFYQNLLGAWPVVPLDDQTRGSFIQRMQENLLKTGRESKVHTSWTNQNAEYEKALSRFVAGSLQPSNGPFLKDFGMFSEDISWYGMLNSLSQVFLKLVSPGIPDIYQGNEILRFCLVDPDNRRSVDFTRRQAMLFPLLDDIGAGESEKLHRNMLANPADGLAKMYVIVKTLQLRRNLQDVFTNGSYLPLSATGEKSQHLCAFAREKNGRLLIAVAPRLYFLLMAGSRELPLGDSVWHDTRIELPKECTGMQLHNIFADDAEHIEHVDHSESGRPALHVGRLLQSWPVALLQGQR